jgi:hypothetical protein
MKRLIFVFFFSALISFGQTKDELELCAALKSNEFSSNLEAEKALDLILGAIGAASNFVLAPCNNVSNALATSFKGTRYILYNKNFMRLINKNTNNWSSLFILAHEVGHHINGHSIDILLYTGDVIDTPSLVKKRKQELEADEFAAFVLAKLGANLNQLNNVIYLISDNTDDKYSTHPSRDKRLASVRKGFNNGFEKKETSIVIINDSKKHVDRFPANRRNTSSWWPGMDQRGHGLNGGSMGASILNDGVYFNIAIYLRNIMIGLRSLSDRSNYNVDSYNWDPKFGDYSESSMEFNIGYSISKKWVLFASLGNVNRTEVVENPDYDGTDWLSGGELLDWDYSDSKESLNSFGIQYVSMMGSFAFIPEVFYNTRDGVGFGLNLGF